MYGTAHVQVYFCRVGVRLINVRSVDDDVIRVDDLHSLSRVSFDRIDACVTYLHVST
jgi:hypothetical protein